MLAREENDMLTLVSPDKPMGQLMRRYWIPALLAAEIPEPDCPPVRVRLLGEDLVAFRDTQGPNRPARRALRPSRHVAIFWQERRVRTALHLSWLEI